LIRWPLTALPHSTTLRDSVNPTLQEPEMGGISNRMKEIKRRRHRRQAMAKFQARLPKATTSEKQLIAEKIRKMTPGCEDLVIRLGLEEGKA